MHKHRSAVSTFSFEGYVANLNARNDGKGPEQLELKRECDWWVGNKFARSFLQKRLYMIYINILHRVSVKWHR